VSNVPYHKSLRLENFTAFADTAFEFVPGVNVLVGENGTGKTHAMKALYAMQVYQSRRRDNIYEILGRLFQTSDLSVLMRMGGDTRSASASGEFGVEKWDYKIIAGTGYTTETGRITMQPERPVFIPAIDMMGHTKGFLAAANEVVLDFDLTCTDIVALMGLERRHGSRHTEVPKLLAKLLDGKLDYDESDSRFYLVTPHGRLPMPMVAEGLRKIATLVRLLENGWLAPGATLFWDEPEVNVNPALMDDVVGALFALARSGVQMFLTTHSYVILKELDLQATLDDKVRFFSLTGSKTGTNVTMADTLAELDPNPIHLHYASLYDRDLDRALGKGRRRGAVSRK
jgi:hypothetical protein